MTKVNLLDQGIKLNPLQDTTPDAVAGHIAFELERNGVSVSIQPAVTTNSIYLIFDGGLLNSCRVADHSGKGYKYKYEIGTHYLIRSDPDFKYEGEWYRRHLFPAEQANALIMQVLTQRQDMYSKYGMAWYKNRKRETDNV